MQPLFPCEESFLWPQLLDLTGLKICRGLKYAHQVFSEYLLISARLLIRDISEFLDNSQNFVSCFVFLSSTRVCVLWLRCHFLVLKQLNLKKKRKKLDRLWASFAGMTQYSNKSINGNKTVTFESILQLFHRDVLPFRCAPNALTQSDNHNCKSEDPVFSCFSAVPCGPSVCGTGRRSACYLCSAELQHKSSLRWEGSGRTCAFGWGVQDEMCYIAMTPAQKHRFAWHLELNTREIQSGNRVRSCSAWLWPSV